MVQTPFILAVVPAKLTSLRVPQKNIADVAGQPLFHYSIKAAMRVKGIHEVCVTSESEEVLAQARNQGANTILRPDALSEAGVTNLQVLEHVVSTYDKIGKYPDLIVLLQPTHPFRNPADISSALADMINHSESDCLMAVRGVRALHGVVDQGMFCPDSPLISGRSLECGKYVNTGSFYIYRTTRTINNGRLLGNSIRAFILTHPELEIDIDEPVDLLVARALSEQYREVLIEWGLLEPSEPL